MRHFKHCFGYQLKISVVIETGCHQLHPASLSLHSFPFPRRHCCWTRALGSHCTSSFPVSAPPHPPLPPPPGSGRVGRHAMAVDGSGGGGGGDVLAPRHSCARFPRRRQGHSPSQPAGQPGRRRRRQRRIRLPHRGATTAQRGDGTATAHSGLLPTTCSTAVAVVCRRRRMSSFVVIRVM